MLGLSSVLARNYYPLAKAKYDSISLSLDFCGFVSIASFIRPTNISCSHYTCGKNRGYCGEKDIKSLPSWSLLSWLET